MSGEIHGTTQEVAPTCYRHRDRPTWVSCGRCGRPLCPDCVRMGPVGTRCEECLRPPRLDIMGGEPERVHLALGVAAGQAVLWVILLVCSGLFANTWSPNLLLSAIAGGMVGWSIWRICGCAWNTTTLRWAVILGVLMPLLGALILFGMFAALIKLSQPGALASLPLAMFGARALCAVALSTFFAFVLVKRRR